MKTRILTAVPLALLVVAFVWWGPKWLFLLILLLLVEISLYEFFQLARAAGVRGIPWFAYLAGAALCLAQTVSADARAELLEVILLTSVFLAATFSLFRGKDLKEYWGCAASTVLGILYIGFCFSWFFPLRFSGVTDGRAAVLFLLLVNWAGDAFANHGPALFRSDHFATQNRRRLDSRTCRKRSDRMAVLVVVLADRGAEDGYSVVGSCLDCWTNGGPGGIGDETGRRIEGFGRPFARARRTAGPDRQPGVCCSGRVAGAGAQEPVGLTRKR